MEHVLNNKSITKSGRSGSIKNLSQAEIDKEYIIKDITANDADLKKTSCSH